jgi:UrcA family protein
MHLDTFTRGVSRSVAALALYGASALALYGATALVAHATPAADPPPTLTKKVSLADLDLTTPAGERAALERLHAMARTLCSRLEDELDLGRQPRFVACVEDAMAAAAVRLQALAHDRAKARGLASNRPQ